MTIEKAIVILNSCDGNCKSCKYWRLKFAEVNEQLKVYAYYCDIARKAGCIWYGERLAKLKQETIKLLQAEIENNQHSFM